MIPLTSPPKSRRRWVISLVAMLALGWWFRPWVDQRFVGVWQGLNPVGNDPMSISIISNNGELTNFSRHDHFGVVLFSCEWWVLGDEFFIRFKSRSKGLQAIREQVAEAYKSFFHGTNVRPPIVYKIQVVSPSSIRMTFPDGVERVITRVAGSN
jgi:hypothetical protein